MKEKILSKWKATVISVPVTVIMFFLAMISTGAWHGSAVIVYIYYAPVHALGKISLTTDKLLLSILNGLVMLVLWLVFIFLHPNLCNICRFG